MNCRILLSGQINKNQCTVYPYVSISKNDAPETLITSYKNILALIIPNEILQGTQRTK